MEKSVSEKENFFSIVIAARNEEENLKKLVPKLLQQEYANFDITISLDRCSDESKSYLEGLKSPQIRIINNQEVPTDWNPKKFALQQAVELIQGDWIVFTDADCIPNSDRWLSLINESITEQSDIIIGVSPYVKGGAFLSSYMRFESYMTAFTYTARALQGKPYMGVGRNLSIRRSFFEEKNGYQSIKEINGGDDDLFIQSHATKRNTQVMLGDESTVLTYPEKTWKDYFQQKIRHFSVSSRYKSRDQILLSAIHSTHLLFILSIPLVWTSINFGWMLLFYLFIKLVGYRFAASKIGININYILLPLVDMLYAVLTPVLALWSKLVKDIPWKN